MRKIILLLLMVLLSAQSFALSWNDAMQLKLSRYQYYSQEMLAPYFEQVGLPYVPHKLAFLIFKDTKTFELYARMKDSDHWRYVRSYPVEAASGHLGPKLHEGDYQVPEGIYHITAMNPNSRFDLSLHLNYPNHFDRAMAARAHRENLGGNIFIHGSDRSIGCIALGDDTIEQLFPLVYDAGERHVLVVIAPNDFRREPVNTNTEHLAWLPVLYANLSKELAQFPIPRGQYD